MWKRVKTCSMYVNWWINTSLVKHRICKSKLELWSSNILYFQLFCLIFNCSYKLLKSSNKIVVITDLYFNPHNDLILSNILLWLDVECDRYEIFNPCFRHFNHSRSHLLKKFKSFRKIFALGYFKFFKNFIVSCIQGF